MRESLLSADLATVFNDPSSRTVGCRPSRRTPIYLDIDVREGSRTRSSVRPSRWRSTGRSSCRSPAARSPVTLADGVIKPNLALDYAPSGMWTGLLGKAIPDSGDPEYAKQLIQESGKPMPIVTFTYRRPPTTKVAASIKASLEKAGMKVKLNPIESSAYYTTILDDSRATTLMENGWGPDWPNASTVIPPLFTQKGGWDVSRGQRQGATTPRWRHALSETDRTKQAEMWKAPQQGGHAAGVGHPDAVRERPAPRRLEG